MLKCIAQLQYVDWMCFHIIGTRGADFWSGYWGVSKKYQDTTWLQSGKCQDPIRLQSGRIQDGWRLVYCLVPPEPGGMWSSAISLLVLNWAGCCYWSYSCLLPGCLPLFLTLHQLLFLLCVLDLTPVWYCLPVFLTRHLSFTLYCWYLRVYVLGWFLTSHR